MTQLALPFDAPAPRERSYVDVCVERGWDVRNERPWQWKHTLSEENAAAFLVEAAQLWPDARVWVA